MALSSYSHGDERLSKDYSYIMQSDRLEVFKSQDFEKGHFDVTYEAEGNKLHAHKFILTTVSEPMNAKFSDRWATNDEIIKVVGYSYKTFYEFLCFIYSGSCNLTNENIFELVDIAEYYGVSYLKEFCDKFLIKSVIITIENIQEMYEFADKYSLPDFFYAVGKYVMQNGDAVIEGINSSTSKSFIEFICAELKDIFDIKHFETVYKWAEHQVKKNTPDLDERHLQEAVKNELNTIISHFEIWKMSIGFVRTFISKGFSLSPNDFCKFFLRLREHNTENSTLKIVYLAAVLQAAAQKQQMSVDGSVKKSLTEVVSHIILYQVEKTFLMNSIVIIGLITEEQINRAFETRVEIRSHGFEISGIFMDDYGIRRAFEKCGSKNAKQTSFKKRRFYNVHIRIPSTPSTVTKVEGIQ